MSIITTKTNSRGEYQFSGLAAGRYRITPVARNSYDTFSPAKYELNVSHNISQLYFYVGQEFRIFHHGSGGSVTVPAGPKYDSDTDGTYDISGKLSVPGISFFGVGGYTINCEYLGVVAGTDILPDPEEPRPDPTGRIVPAELLAHKQSTKQSTCYCWAIFPEVGDPESFTSLDKNITLPSYDSPPGQDDEVFTIPAMTYLSKNGVMTTTIPTRLDLGKDGIEVTVLAFDRDKLLRQYYRNAQFEVFELNYRGDLSQRIIWASGILGEATVGDISASISLSMWTDVANREVGRNYGAQCDVGHLNEFPGEEFGAGRCRNAILNDGPLKADWTVEATVTAVDTDHGRMRFTITHGDTATSTVALDDNFDDHLAQGKVLFLTGDNAGITRETKSGDGDGSSGVDLEMHTPFPMLIEVGDTLQLTAGCRRTPEDCKFYNNFHKNFRGFIIPGREAVIRSFS